MQNTFSDAESHVVQRIINSPVQQEPFEHCVVDDIFPEGLFSALHDMWPGDEVMKPISETGRTVAQTKKGVLIPASEAGKAKVYQERHVMLFDDRFLEMLLPSVTDFWFRVRSVATNSAVVNACIRKFQKTLTARVRHLKGNVHVDPELLVISDHSNYKIGPHTDLPTRFITLLFYLSREEKYRSYGTGLYVPKDSAVLDTETSHHKFKDFTLHSRVDFVPNRAVIFPRTNHSFHGVEPVPVENCDRRLLIVNVRAPEGAL